jgi:hypothetical protein
MPVARRDKLIIRQVADETLVYDRRNTKAHCLNGTAAWVWQHCDGQTTVGDIARLLEAESHAPVNEQVVWLALEQLQKFQLLQLPLERPAGMTPISRRELMRLGAKTAVVTLPLIVSIIAPTAAAAASAISSNECDLRRSNCGGTPCVGGGICQNPGTMGGCHCA